MPNRNVIPGSLVSALILCLGFVTNASAGAFNGSYNYSITGQTSNPGCQTTYGGNPWTDNFASTSGSNSVAADPVSFSICDGVNGLLAGGQFSIGDGSGDAITGTFSGVLVGLSGGGGDIFDGTFAISSRTGYYSSATNAGGNFEVVTGQVNTPAFVTGTFDFESVPEPLAAALAGSGLVLLGLSRKLLKRRT